jgi:hypothetical protein
MFEEWRSLSAGECCLRQLCCDRLALFINQRAAYWKQCGKFRALQEGNANTKFFQARAAMRARHSQIHHLEINGVTLITHGDKMAALTNYYTSILGRVVTASWGLDLQALYAG